MSARTTSGAKGITAQAISAAVIDTTGAMKNKKVAASRGWMISLSSSLMTSAKGCSSPW